VRFSGRWLAWGGVELATAEPPTLRCKGYGHGASCWVSKRLRSGHRSTHITAKRPVRCKRGGRAFCLGRPSFFYPANAFVTVCPSTMELEGETKHGIRGRNESPMKSLLVLLSYHHKNTEKIAKVIAGVLDAQIKTPQQTDPQELQEYDLVGFGSGIYGAKHHKALLDLADRLPQVTNRRAFIFSTCGAPMTFMELDEAEFTEYVAQNHSSLRDKLESKGYVIVDEFSCAGFNTNSINRLFGGINKGRPNAEDLKHAEAFAEHLKQDL